MNNSKKNVFACNDAKWNRIVRQYANEYRLSVTDATVALLEGARSTGESVLRETKATGVGRLSRMEERVATLEELVNELL